MRLQCALVVVFALTISTFALAEPGSGQGACKNDLQTLCAGVQPGGGRIRDCMKEHRAQLSASCKIAIADRMLDRAGQHPGGARASMEHTHQSVLDGQAAIKQMPTGN